MEGAISFFVEYKEDGREDKELFNNNNEVTIRFADENDINFLAEISCDRIGSYDKLEEYKQFWGRKFESRSENLRKTFIVTIIDNETGREEKIGYSNIEYMRFHDQKDEGGNSYTAPEGWYLLGIVVYPKYRRLGVGSKLIDVRVNWAKENSNDKKIYFYTNPKNITSMAFHEDLGFRKVGKDLTFPGRPVFKTVFFEMEL